MTRSRDTRRKSKPKPRAPRAPAVTKGVPIKTLIEDVAQSFIGLNVERERIEREQVVNGAKPDDLRPTQPGVEPKTYAENTKELDAMRARLATRYKTIMPLVRKRIKEIEAEQESSG